eukprot:scaffold24859_cov71-Phaeocystis_antarctica.AAC.2
MAEVPAAMMEAAAAEAAAAEAAAAEAAGGRDRDRGDARAARRQDMQQGVAHVDGDGPRRHGLHDREARGSERGVLAARRARRAPAAAGM